MSLARCLELIERCFDRDQDIASLFDELAELESETLEQGPPEKYHEPVAAFLERTEELFSEDEPEDALFKAAVSSLRSDLELLKSRQVPEDPLEHLFFDLNRYELGSIPASTALSTLSRYEALLLGLREHFEKTTDPSDQREIVGLMRAGLERLEKVGRRLRTDLGNGLDHAFDEIRAEYKLGTQTLKDFQQKATFADPDGTVA